jgi:mannose-1-phosphate guanylyltransferase/mannose-1-phosphate guanylyltransferase/mannose-6-phosphate isomerase
MDSPNRITPVLLCGGSGTRLWPLSRRNAPKQLLALTGAETMLQLTIARNPAGDMFDSPVVVAGAELEEAIRAQLAGAAGADARLILEPCRRNTAPAAALAALTAAPGDILLVMPCDHFIGDVDAFLAAVGEALPWAERDWLVTFGIRPTHAETGYGYIRRGSPLSASVFAVEHFIEKPELAKAETFLSQGGYDWNGGIFLFRARTYLEALEAHAPEILAAAREAVGAAPVQGDKLTPDAAAFARCPDISIDHAVMEKSGRIAVVPVDMAWSDLGSWEALWDVSARDEDANVLTGEVLAMDSRRCLIRSTGPLVVAIGVEDLVVVATEDAVLVVRRDESQRVKTAVEALSRKGHRSIR